MKTENFIKPFLKKEVPDIRPGDTVKVYQKIKEAPKEDKPSKRKEAKEKIQTFEGVVIAKKHGKEIGATITVRKVISGIGVEKILPLYLPTIEKIEILRRSKVRRTKLYYLRTAKGRKAKLKRIDFKEKVGLTDKVVAKPEKKEEGKDKEIEENKEKK
ncbi:MAG: 50S ribosomal protein L19 [Candidatus Paceibacterales bacterium]